MIRLMMKHAPVPRLNHEPGETKTLLLSFRAEVAPI
jgi:hypothetical protein